MSLSDYAALRLRIAMASDAALSEVQSLLNGNYPAITMSGPFKGNAVNGLTAHAGGGQGSATALTADLNRVTTVATIGDSVVLPAAKAGREVTVANAAANSMNVFPLGATDVINALAVQTAFAVAGGKTCTFYCFNDGQWHSQLSA